MYAPFIHISFLAFHFPAIKKPQKQSAYTALIFEKSLNSAVDFIPLSLIFLCFSFFAIFYCNL